MFHLVSLLSQSLREEQLRHHTPHSTTTSSHLHKLIAPIDVPFGVEIPIYRGGHTGKEINQSTTAQRRNVVLQRTLSACVEDGCGTHNDDANEKHTR